MLCLKQLYKHIVQFEMSTHQEETLSQKLKRKLITSNANASKNFKASAKLNSNFFNVSCYNLARSLLGKILVRCLDDGTILQGRIVETECYLGNEDKASHSYNGRRTPCNEPMYMPAGTSYVYKIYGMYDCFNISSTEPGAAVLIRSVEPLTGMEAMRSNRIKKIKSGNAKYFKDKDLCNGPSKLCISMEITKESCNKENLCLSNFLWVEEDHYKENIIIVKSKRIGIKSAGEEWAAKLLRFYVLNNANVSKRDKIAEAEFNNKK